MRYGKRNQAKVTAMAKNDFKIKQSIGILLFALVTIVTQMIAPTMAINSVVGFLTDSAVVDFLRGVFGVVAILLFIDLLSGWLKGSNEGWGPKAFFCCMGIIMATSYDSVIKMFGLDF